MEKYEGRGIDQIVNWILINLNLFIPIRCIIRFFLVNYRHSFPSDWNDNILSEISSANDLVLTGIFSVNLPLFGYQQQRTFKNRVFLSACWHGTWKRVKCLVVARCYVELGRQFIHTKEFNSKQGCITIHPRTFLVGETTNYNQLWGIDLSLALHKHFWDSHDRRWMDF